MKLFFKKIIFLLAFVGCAATAQAQKSVQELEDLKNERKQVRTRIEKLLGQMDLLSGS